MSERTQDNPADGVLSSPLGIAQAAQAYAESIVDTVREPLLILRTDLRIQSASRSFYRTFHVTPEETLGCPLYELGNGQWDIPGLRTRLEEILPRHTELDDYEVTHDFPGIGPKTMLLTARRLYREGNNTSFLLLAIEDVTERRCQEEERRQTHTALEEAYGALEVEHRLLRKAFDRERRITQVLQQPLLMETPEDAFPGLSMATLLQAASHEAEVGGDFHDAFALADGRVALVVGDATGKGLTAAVRAVETRELLRGFMRLYPYYPALTLSRLSDYLYDAHRLDEWLEDTFMALALAVVDAKRGVVTASWAAIDPPVILHADGAAETLRGGGPPLGAVHGEAYPEVTVELNQGDTLVLATDGLSEARRGNEFLMMDGVLSLLQTALSDGATLRGAAQCVLTGAQDYAGGRLQDDACLLLARRL